jgi:hypothetical protein
MSTTTLSFTGEIVVTTCWCGIRHGVPRELYDFQKRQHNNGQKQQGIYCPLGHYWEFSGKGEAERLREEKERLERVTAAKERSLEIVREQRDRAQRSNAALRGVVTKTKRRIGNGTCPCCNRHFSNVERHMKSQHPQFAADDPASSVGAREGAQR